MKRETRKQVEAGSTKTTRIKKPPVPLEREVMKGVAKVIEQLGLKDHIHRRNTGAMRNPAGQLVRFGRPGDSDFGGMQPCGPGSGRAISIKVKRPGKKPTPAQMEHLIKVNEAGGVAFWVDDPAVAHNILRQILQGGRVEIEADGSQFLVFKETA